MLELVEADRARRPNCRSPRKPPLHLPRGRSRLCPRKQKLAWAGGSPGIVVMGGDSRPRGRGFGYWMDIFANILLL